MNDEIVITNIVPGASPTVISCDVTIGCVVIHAVTLRSSERGTFINLPRAWVGGRWGAAVSIADADMLDKLRGAVVIAAAEALRYNFA